MSAQKFLLLRADIDRTLTQIAAVVAEGRETLEKLDGSPTTLELRGIGSILHDFYTGIEQLLEHIASELDGDIPVGADWHAQLLGRMTSVIESVRPAVLELRPSRRAATLSALPSSLQEYIRCPIALGALPRIGHGDGGRLEKTLRRNGSVQRRVEEFARRL